MHIIKSIAFAAATVCAGQAYALTPTDMNAAGTLKIYVGGASALSAAIGGLFTQNCNAATRTDYTYPTTAGFGTIYTCTLNATNDFGLGAVNVMFQKRDAGGSGIGVYPVANNTPIDFIDPTSCSGGASGTGTCTALFSRTADGGVSDVEPAMFAATQNTPPEFVGASIGTNATSVPINQTIFGLAVSNSLYTALQAAQGTTGRPSVPQAVIGQMLRSGFDYVNIGWSLLLPSTPLSQVTICRRVNGSGTQASANRFFLEYPFNSGADLVPYTAGDSTTGSHGTAASQLFVFEGPGTGDVRNCLSAANTAGGFAMGHISLENAETAAWKFVKIGGQEPSRDEAKAGRYAYFVESTGQVSNSAPSNVQSFLNTFFAGAGSPDNLNALLPAVRNGVMTPPANPACPNTFNTGTPNQQAFCSRVTREGNSANFPVFFR